MMTGNNVKETQTFYFDNAIVRVHRPCLTEEERARRMKEIQRAAEKLLLETMKNKKGVL